MNLSKDQINRYSRQIVLKEVGGIGQERLLNSRITAPPPEAETLAIAPLLKVMIPKSPPGIVIAVSKGNHDDRRLSRTPYS